MTVDFLLHLHGCKEFLDLLSICSFLKKDCAVLSELYRTGPCIMRRQGYQPQKARAAVMRSE